MRGFSLVELQVSMVIFVAMAAGMYQALGTGMSVYTVGNVNVGLQQQARQAMERFVREVRASSAPAIMRVDGNGDRISFNTPDKIDVQYYLKDGRLVRQYPVSVVLPVADSISRFKLQMTGKIIKVDIQASQISYGKTVTVSLSEEVGLRNE